MFQFLIFVLYLLFKIYSIKIVFIIHKKINNNIFWKNINLFFKLDRHLIQYPHYHLDIIIRFQVIFFHHHLLLNYLSYLKIMLLFVLISYYLLILNFLKLTRLTTTFAIHQSDYFGDRTCFKHKIFQKIQ